MLNSMDISPVPRRVNDANGVNIRRFVVRSSLPDQVRRPTGANVAGVDGVVEHLGYQGADGDTVAVRKLGEAELIATGPIGFGDDVTVGDAQGGVASAAGLALGAVVNKVGEAQSIASAAGDVVKVFLTLGVRYTK